MITLPISDLLLLPGVTFFFKKDVFPSGEITAESVGEDICNGKRREGTDDTG